MKVFLSWSGVRSRMAAAAFRDWLPYVINEVEPWMSSEDMMKGSRWSSELADRLAKTEFALIFVTPENQFAPWLLFEAGALSSSLGGAVATVLLDIDTEDLVVSPLSQFQDTKLKRDDVFRLVETMNKKVSWRLSESRLPKAFDMWWEKLEEQVGEAWLAKFEESGVTHPSASRDLVIPTVANGRRFRPRVSQWLEEFAHAMKAPPRTVKARFRVRIDAVPDVERLFAGRSCPAHPRFIALEKQEITDGYAVIEAKACCRFALLIANDDMRDLVC